MKIEREIILLEKSIAKNDLVSARYIIERNIDTFSHPGIRAQISLNALALLNSIIHLKNSKNSILFSRETQLIIQHINTLARNSRFAELKSYTFLQKDLLSNSLIYNALNEDAKAFIPKPKETPQ